MRVLDNLGNSLHIIREYGSYHPFFRLTQYGLNTCYFIRDDRYLFKRRHLQDALAHQADQFIGVPAAQILIQPAEDLVEDIRRLYAYCDNILISPVTDARYHTDLDSGRHGSQEL